MKIYPVRVAAIAALLYILIVPLPVYFRGLARGDRDLLFLFLFFGGGLALFIGGLFLSILSLRSALRREHRASASYVLGAVIGFASPFLASSLLPFATRSGELRDLNAIGLPKLRDDVLAVMTASEGKAYEPCRFGRLVPFSDLPPSLQRLAAKSSYAAVSRSGIVIVNGDKGNVREGYLITPTGSTFAPGMSRRIADGFFDIFAR
jgi:hypothetical protein